MKLSKKMRARKNLMTSAEQKKVVTAARTLFDFGIITSDRANLIARNYK